MTVWQASTLRPLNAWFDDDAGAMDTHDVTPPSRLPVAGHRHLRGAGAIAADAD